MVKKTQLPRTRRSTNKAIHTSTRPEKIAKVIAELDQIKPLSVRAAAAIALFKSWLTDESGYDEKIGPRLWKALEKERDPVGARRLFDA